MTGLVLGGANAGNYTSNTTATTSANITATVFGSHVFYNGSTFYGRTTDSSKVIAKSGAAAQPLSFASVMNSSRGISGITLEIAGLNTSNLTTSDFGFRMSPISSTVGAPSTWNQTVPTPSIIVETQGTATTPGRVRLQWQPNAIANRWLQIQVLATPNTG